MHIILQTPRTFIRQFTEDEEHLMLLMGEDERVTRYTTRRTPDETRLLFKQMLIDYQSQPLLGRWAIINRETDEFMGLCMLLTARQGLSGIELGYSFQFQYWGMGYATEVVRALVDYGFHHAGVTNMCAITTPDNNASQHVLIKAGFTPKEPVYIGEEMLPLFEKKKED